MRKGQLGTLTRPEMYLRNGRVPMPKTLEVQIDDAPGFLRGLRAAFVCDVHLTKRTPDARIDAILHAVYAMRADILLLGGDLGEGLMQSLRFLQRLDPTRFRLGVYAVRGNNDCELCECDAARVLVNECEDVPVNGGTLQIAGVDEYLYGTPDSAYIFGSNTYDAAHCYRLLLSHYPVLPECNANLMLSGHTHGGQMNLFGVTPYTIGFERTCPLCAVRGMHRFGDLRVYVSPGIGTSRVPLRLGVFPEITLLKF